jgi:hypothetical protein
MTARPEGRVMAPLPEIELVLTAAIVQPASARIAVLQVRNGPRQKRACAMTASGRR